MDSTRASSPALAILTPADAGWDQARLVGNLAADQRPAAIAEPTSTAEVITAVEFARTHGLRVTAQDTGHGAAALGSLADTLLVKTNGMRHVRIDPAARIARVEAGALWQDVVDAASEHGLAALAGPSPDIGAVGYTLGGGLGWLGRAYGLAANSIQAIEVVTADARVRRADRCTEQDLFWALRGGGGSFGVVTAVEFELFPITEVYGGLLRWPAERAREVLHTWRRLTETGVPDEFTSAARLMRFPATPEIPEVVSGGSFVVVDVIHLGATKEADALLCSLRELEPELDTVTTISMPALAHLHRDPEHSTAAIGDGLTLSAVPAEAVDRIVRVFAEPIAARLASVELRQIGGEMACARAGNGALAAVDAPYALCALGHAETAAGRFAVRAAVAAVMSALAPWAARQMYLNLAETSWDPARFWSQEAYSRLRRIKAAVDPDNLIRANHPILPVTR